MKPCIRGLKEFKRGCPENNSCPAWIETLGSLHPKPIRQCSDVAMVHLLWDLNCNVIGAQQATENLRNGLCEEDPITKQPVPRQLKLTIVKATEIHERIRALPDR